MLPFKLHPAGRKRLWLKPIAACICFDAPCAGALPHAHRRPEIYQEDRERQPHGFGARDPRMPTCSGLSCSRVCPVDVSLRRRVRAAQSAQEQPIAIGRLSATRWNTSTRQNGNSPVAPNSPDSSGRARRLHRRRARFSRLRGRTSRARRHGVTVFDKRSARGGLNTYGVARSIQVHSRKTAPAKSSLGPRHRRTGSQPCGDRQRLRSSRKSRTLVTTRSSSALAWAQRSVSTSPARPPRHRGRARLYLRFQDWPARCLSVITSSSSAAATQPSTPPSPPASRSASK